MVAHFDGKTSQAPSAKATYPEVDRTVMEGVSTPAGSCGQYYISQYTAV